MRSFVKKAAAFVCGAALALTSACGLAGTAAVTQAAEDEARAYLYQTYLSEGATADEAASWTEIAIANGFTMASEGLETVYGAKLQAGQQVAQLNFSITDLLCEAATRLGAYYIWGRKGQGSWTCGIPVGSVTPIGSQPACAVSPSGGYDCSGYIYDVLRHFGITMNNAWKNAAAASLSEASTGLPMATYGWYAIPNQGMSFQWEYKGTYVQQTAANVRVYRGRAAMIAAMDAGQVRTGDIIERQNSGGGHIAFYLGRFASTDEVIAYA